MSLPEPSEREITARHPPLIDHKIHLFFGLTFNGSDIGARLTALKLKDVATDRLVHPTRLAPGAQRPIADRSLWEWAAWDVSPDLHPFVHAILDSRADGSGKPSYLRLSPYALNMVTGRYRQQSVEGKSGVSDAALGFVVHLPSASQLRLNLAGADPGVASPNAMRLVIDGVDIHLFRTNFGVAVMTLRVLVDGPNRAQPQMLIELMPRLCDERSGDHLSWADEAVRKARDRFSPGKLLHELIESAHCRQVPRDRTYSFCAIVFDAALPDAATRDIAFRLSRHYNARYRPTVDLAGTTFVDPFETVLHAMSREGVCTVVDRTTDEGETIEFLESWTAQAHARVYLPLQIAAFHEHVVLLDLAQGAGQHIDLNTTSEKNRSLRAAHLRRVALETARLRELCDRFLLFRLRYRLSQVSSLTAHDLAYNATEHALGLPALSDKIARDMLAVERRLLELADETREERGRRLEWRFALFVGIGSAALTYLTLTTAAEHVQKALPGNIHLNPLFDLAIQIIAVLFAAVAGYYNWQRQRAGHDEMEHYVEHAGAHVAIEEAEGGAGADGMTRAHTKAASL